MSNTKQSKNSLPSSRLSFSDIYQDGEGLDYIDEFHKAYRTAYFLMGEREIDQKAFKQQRGMVEVCFGMAFLMLWSESGNRAMLLRAIERANNAAALFEQVGSDCEYRVRDWIQYMQKLASEPTRKSA